MTTYEVALTLPGLRIPFICYETARSPEAAISKAERYARAQGYTDAPTFKIAKEVSK